MEKKEVICEIQKNVCPHIVKLNASIELLAKRIESIMQQAENGKIEENAEEIMKSLTLEIPIEELKMVIERLTTGIIEQQNNMIQTIEALQEDIKELEKDHLTGLYTRQRYEKDFEKFQKGFVEKNKWFSLGVIDIDNFKEINDTHGHIGWDQALKYIAEILKTKFWTHHVYRYGGEEFIILYTGWKNKLYKWLLEVLDFLHQKNLKRHIKFNITFSWWVTEAQRNDTHEVIFQRADALMYRAKRNGKNQVSFSE